MLLQEASAAAAGAGPISLSPERRARASAPASLSTHTSPSRSFSLSLSSTSATPRSSVVDEACACTLELAQLSPLQPPPSPAPSPISPDPPSHRHKKLKQHHSQPAPPRSPLPPPAPTPAAAAASASASAALSPDVSSCSPHTSSPRTPLSISLPPFCTPLTMHAGAGGMALPPAHSRSMMAAGSQTPDGRSSYASNWANYIANAQQQPQAQAQAQASTSQRSSFSHVSAPAQPPALKVHAGMDDPPPRLPVPGHSCPLVLAPAALPSPDPADRVAASSPTIDDEEVEDELHADEYRPLLPTVKGSSAGQFIAPATLMELLKGTRRDSGAAVSTPIAGGASPSMSRRSWSASSPTPGSLARLYERVIVVDCRFPYEHAGGHIRGALNLYTPAMVFDYFLRSPPQNMAAGQKICVVFHCEYSQERGPYLCGRLRRRDREAHLHDFQQLYFPELYILQGGYKAFYKEFGQAANSALSTPRGPTPCHPSLLLPSFPASFNTSMVRSISVPLAPNAPSAASSASAASITPVRPHPVMAALSGASTSTSTSTSVHAAPIAPSATGPHAGSATHFQSIASTSTCTPLSAHSPDSLPMAQWNHAGAVGACMLSGAQSPEVTPMEGLTIEEGEGTSPTNAARSNAQPAAGAASGVAQRPSASSIDDDCPSLLFNSVVPSYVRMRDHRYRDQCVTLMRDHEAEKRLTRSASMGAFSFCARGSYGGAESPAMGAPPTPPTPRLHSSMRAASPLNVMHSPVTNMTTARTMLTPRLRAASLQSAGGVPPAGAAAAATASMDVPSTIDLHRSELRMSRRRSASTHLRGGTPIAFGDCPTTDPNTPQSPRRQLLPPHLPSRSGRDSVGSACNDTISPTIPTRSLRSPAMTRCFSMMDSASPPPSASYPSGVPSLSASMGHPSRPMQSPSPSRNILASFSSSPTSRGSFTGFSAAMSGYTSSLGGTPLSLSHHSSLSGSLASPSSATSSGTFLHRSASAHNRAEFAPSPVPLGALPSPSRSSLHHPAQPPSPPRLVPSPSEFLHPYDVKRVPAGSSAPTVRLHADPSSSGSSISAHAGVQPVLKAPAALWGMPHSASHLFDPSRVASERGGEGRATPLSNTPMPMAAAVREEEEAEQEA